MAIENPQSEVTAEASSDWQLTFHRGEACLVTRGLSLGSARVERAVLRLVDVAGPIEFAGGIEPFAHHRTALARLEISLPLAEILQPGEQAYWQHDEIHLHTPELSARICFERVGDRGLRAIVFEALSAERSAGGATASTYRWLRERLGGHTCADPVALFAQRGLVEAGRRRTRLEGGRSGWTFEGVDAVYVFDHSENPGEPLPILALPADWQRIDALVREGRIEDACVKVREAAMTGALSPECAWLAADLLAERDDSLDLLEGILPEVPLLLRRLVAARRRPDAGAWLAAAEAAGAAEIDELEVACLMQALHAGLEKVRVEQVVERLLALDRANLADLQLMASIAERGGNRRLAIAILRRIVGQSSISEVVKDVVRLGELHLAEGNRPRARHYFALALTVADHPAALEGAAWIALEDQDPRFAIACLERAGRHLELPAERRSAHWRTVARLRFETDGLPGLPAAVASLQEASELDPAQRADDLRQAALWWRDAGQIERALNSVEARLELPGDAARWELEAAEILEQLGRHGQAASAASRAVIDREIAPRAYPLLVRALARSGRREGLPNVVRDWFSIAPDAVPNDALHDAVHGLNDRGAMAEALLARQPDRQLHLFRAVIGLRLDEDQLEAADDLLLAAQANHSGDPDLWRLRLRHAERSGDSAGALGALRSLHQFDPTDRTALPLAEALAGLGDFGEAVELLRKTEAGRLRAVGLQLDHFGDASAALELLGPPDTTHPEQLLLGERSALAIGEPSARPWSLLLLDTGDDRPGDPQRVLRLLAAADINDADAQRHVLALLERGPVDDEQLERLRKACIARDLSAAQVRVIEALSVSAPSAALDEERFDLALSLGDAQRASDLVVAVFDGLEGALVGKPLQRSHRFLELLAKAGLAEDHRKGLADFAERFSDPELFGQLGDTLVEEGDPSAAVEAFERAHGLSPEAARPRAENWLAAALSLDAPDALRQAMKALLPSMGKEQELELSVALARRLPPEEACSWWAHARELAPADAGLVGEHALAALEGIDPAAADPIVRRWAELCGDDQRERLSSTVGALAAAHRGRGDHAAAVRLLGAVSQRFPADLELATSWIAAVDAQGDARQMARVRERAGRAVNDLRADRWLLEAEEAYSGPLDQPEEGITVLQVLVSRRPDNPVYALRLEQLAAQMGRWQVRMAAGQQILDQNLDPDRGADRLRAMADIAAERFGDPQHALGLLRSIQPRDAQEASAVTERMIHIAVAAGDQDMVIELLEQVIDGAEDSLTRVEGLIRRAGALAQNGQIDAAFADLAEALAQGGNRLRLAALQVDLAERCGALDRGIEALEMWAREFNDGAERAAVLFRLAEVLKRADRADEGVPHLHAALRYGTRALRERAFAALYPLLVLRGDDLVQADLLAQYAVDSEDRLAAAALMARTPNGNQKALRLAESLLGDEFGRGVVGAAGRLSARLYEALGQPGRAADQFALVRLRGDTGHTPVREEARLRLAAGQPAAALRLIEEHGIAAPEAKAAALESLGRFAEAAESLDGVRAGAATLHRAQLLANRLGQTENAVAAVEALLEREPENVDAVRTLERLGTSLRDPDLTGWARRKLAELLRGDDVLRARWLARAAALCHDPSEALGFLLEARQLDGGSVSIANGLAEVHERMDDPASAAAIYEDLASRSSQLADRIHHLLRAAGGYLKSDTERAVELLSEIEKRVPEDARMLAMFAELARARGDQAEEVRRLRQLAQATHSKEVRLSALRRAAELSGDQELLRMVVLTDPEDLEARLALASMATDSGDVAAAVSQYEHIARAHKGTPAAAALYRAAQLRWTVNHDATGAIEFLGEALEEVAHAGTFPEPFLLLSEIYEARGDVGAAAACLTPLFSVIEQLTDEVAAEVLIKTLSGGLVETAFKYISTLEMERPASVPIQRAMVQYLRGQRDWQGLKERLTWMGDELDDGLADLELCALAEQGQLHRSEEAVEAARARVAARSSGALVNLAGVPVQRVRLPGAMPGESARSLATNAGSMPALTVAPEPADHLVEDSMTLPVEGSPELWGSERLEPSSGDRAWAEGAPDEDMLAAQESPLPALTIDPTAATILRPAEDLGTAEDTEGLSVDHFAETEVAGPADPDEKLTFDWQDEEHLDPLPAGDSREFLAAAKIAEEAADLTGALRLYQAAVANSGDDESLRDEVALFLARHPEV